jgi:hypothetical protein
VWLNFRGLFRAIDEGNAGLNIPAYNGGLFAADPALDALQVPDNVCPHFKDLGDYYLRGELAEINALAFFRNVFKRRRDKRSATGCVLRVVQARPGSVVRAYRFRKLSLL